MDTDELTERVKAKARQLGFALVGVTTPQPSGQMEAYKTWLAAGHHGEMGYLAEPRAVERRSDPRQILPECQSILVLGLPYDSPNQQQAQPGYGRVAAYAWGQDYHEALKPLLQALVAFIEEQLGQPVPNRWYTDSGPLLERELAERAGLGWTGKHSLLINPSLGSYFLLAEILLGVALTAHTETISDHCGSCRRCLEACPTDCILPDRSIDAQRCVSYLTIELKGPIPTELRPGLGDLVFGCDICQQVCPWNQRFAPDTGASVLAADPARGHVALAAGLGLDRQAFNQTFKGSPIKRSKRRGFLRNLAVAAGNSGSRQHVPALRKALDDEEPLVRGHAAWALGRIGGPAAQAALQAAASREPDAYVQAELEQAMQEIEKAPGC